MTIITGYICEMYCLRQHMYATAPTSILSRYPFLIPLVVEYLHDKDVLTALLLINRWIRLDLSGYCLKQFVRQCNIAKIASVKRYLPLRATCVKKVTSLPISLPSEWQHSSLKKISFDVYFNQPIAVGTIPDSISHLSFSSEPGSYHGAGFNRPLLIGSIPSSVTHLEFGHAFNQPIAVGTIPNSVTHLTFGHNFDQPIEVGVIPDSVTHCTFGTYFDQLIVPGSIPHSVTHLKFCPGFRKSLHLPDDSIPPSVISLKFW